MTQENVQLLCLLGLLPQGSACCVISKILSGRDSSRHLRARVPFGSLPRKYPKAAPTLVATHHVQLTGAIELLLDLRLQNCLVAALTIIDFFVRCLDILSQMTYQCSCRVRWRFDPELPEAMQSGFEGNPPEQGSVQLEVRRLSGQLA